MRHREVGVLVYEPKRAMPGFTLIVPLSGKAAYLVGMRGEILHQWSFPLTPGNYAYLLPTGNLLWSGRTDDGPPVRQGKGGLLREYDWDGNMLWEHRDPAQHHDFRRLANGNTIYLGWEALPAEWARKVRGGRPGTERDGVIYGDYLREVGPRGETVWEWHAYRGMEIERYEICPACNRGEFAHANTCVPLPDGNIMVSFRVLNLIVIIDRQSNRLIWEKRDDSWGHQHDCKLLPNGRILLFANGMHTLHLPYSRVIEIDPTSGETRWEFRGAPPWTFFSPNISGAQRLDNENTLICEGLTGRLFEVTSGGEIVWEYISPFFTPYEGGAATNNIFRAYRYAADSPEIAGRLKSTVSW
jgi:hypothetical protein